MGRRKVLARNFEASTFTDDADSCFNMTRDGFSLLARASPEQGAAAPEFCGEIEAGSRGGIALSDRPAATGWNRRRCFRAGRMALRSNSFHPRRGGQRDVVVVVVEIEPTNRPCPGGRPPARLGSLSHKLCLTFDSVPITTFLMLVI